MVGVGARWSYPSPSMTTGVLVVVLHTTGVTVATRDITCREATSKGDDAVPAGVAMVTMPMPPALGTVHTS